MTGALKHQVPLCLALLSALILSQGQPPATPPVVSFAVSTVGVDQVLWPALDVVSAFAVQSCPDATCTTPSVVPGTPTSLCVSCHEFALSYTPPGRRRLHGIGSYYRVQWTPSLGGPVVCSTATAAQDGTGPTSPTSPVYADPNRGSTAIGCGSWASPCSQIADAISACPAPGGTVWLTSGSFAGAGNTEVSFGGKIITVSSIYGSSYTVINGNSANRGFIFDTNEVGAILNGVTVLYGSAGATGSGAAILIDSAAPIISNCYFASGVAPAGNGGAIVITNSQGISPATDPAAITTIVVGTTFINNTAQNGGGISVTGAAVLVSNSLFEYNFATQAGAGRGGAIVATFSGILLTNVVMANGFAVFSGGGVHFEAAITLGLCSGVQMISNAAASFGGAFTSFAGSTCYFTESEFSDNVSGFYGGGMLALYGNATVSYSKINRNRSTYGGGATKALAGSLFLDNCEVANNTANAGAGTEIAGASGYTSVVGISNTVISGNSAVLQGAAFNLGSTNGTTFTNVTFLNNVATSGGAGYCAGDVFPGAGSLVIQDSIFAGNNAELGGSIYATTGCIARISTTTFSGNTAQQYGSAILTAASVSMAITTCSFIGNGNVAGSVPPSGGGAISIGYNQFIVDASSSQTEVTNVSIDGSVFTSNVATDRGGALNLQAGTLTLSRSIFSDNSVTAPTIADVGTGGAVSVVDACLSGACQPAIANITNSNFTGNVAFQAGGALYYSAANTGSQLSYTGGTLVGNSVQYSLAERNKYGLGGAIYVSNNSYSLQSLSFSGNAAYFGGALFASCNFASGSVLQNLAYGANTALLGTDQFWLRSASPSAVLTCSGCTHASSSSLATATEVVQLAFATPPPTAFQSSEPASTFVVGLQDYYGNPGLAEYSGTCQVTYNGTILTLPELGRSVDIYNGTGTFQQLTVEGGIGSSFALQLLCALGTDGQNPLLPTNISIPPITFGISVELCPQGSEERGILCQPCDLNFYNYNDTSCQPCPEGAQCPGGSLGLATPVLTQAGYWRSSSTSADLYRCKTTAACEGYPTASGEAFADEACPQGSVGPLCAACAPGSFGFGDRCQTCSASPQGKLMLAFAVLLITALLVVLFVFDFGTNLKPGVMIKVKTLLTHFQLMSLLRTYDVTWPTATQQTLSWSDTLNVGLSVAAPGCWIPHYNFYVFYLIQMAMPIVLVLFCVGVFLGAAKAGVQLETYLEDGVFTKELPEVKAQAWHTWLSALQTRCYKNAFWFVTLLYPRCAQTSLQMFATQTLDVGTFLKADYSISTRTLAGAISSTYAVYLVFGTVLVIVFTLVLPIFYFYVIWRLRFRLQEEAVIQRYSFLYGGYSFPYWEVADMVRKLAIAAVPVFIKPQPTGSLQAVLGEVIMVIYIFVISYLKPFASPNDNLLQVGSMLVLFLLLLSGESLKWAKLSSTQEQYMSDAQVLLTTGVVVAVVLYGFLTLSIVRRGAKAAYWRLTGAANRVAPVGPEVKEASLSVHEAEKDPQAKAEERAWDASYNSSEEYADDGGSSSYSSGDGTRHSPRDGSLASQDKAIVDNPLVLALSQQQSRKFRGHGD